MDGSRETREAADAWSRQDLRVDRTRVGVATVALTGRRSHQHLLPCDWKPRARARTHIFGGIERALAETFRMRACAKVVRPIKCLTLVSQPTPTPHP